MLKFLNSPFPAKYSTKENIIVAILVGTFVALFLFLFKPFGVEKQPINDFNPLLRYVGFGVVTFLGLIFIDNVIPRFFPKFFIESNYTVKKELAMNLLMILVIAIGNIGYLAYLIPGSLNVLDGLIMIWHTFLVGVFPLVFLNLLKFNRLLNANLKASNEINLSGVSSLIAEKTLATPSLTFSVDSVDKTLDLTDLLYIESVGNYINIAINNDGEPSRNLYRKTLKSIEEGVKYKHIIRCHRSYIVNLKKVIEVKGNAQGLKLTLEGCQDEIPVSRKYIKDVKTYFNQGGI